ncbi:phosphopantetheine-binding protein [Streptomyces sp. NPDC058676]|uniref:phosphopantetheine-binding protein n=1 Tax=unclassified Streptomyces TaxID=2593676 RepID=UPI0036524960
MVSSGNTVGGPTTEEMLRIIWQDVLEVPRVEYSDNFFDLGGHSVLLHTVREEMRTRMGADVPLTDLFTYPTIGAVAAHLRDQRGVSDGPVR